jgi:hypothetical protein
LLLAFGPDRSDATEPGRPWCDGETRLAVRRINVIAANFKRDSRRTRSSTGGETIRWACNAQWAIASASRRYRGRRRRRSASTMRPFDLSGPRAPDQTVPRSPSRHSPLSGLRDRLGGMPAGRRRKRATHHSGPPPGIDFLIIERREFTPYSDVNRLAAPPCAPAGLAAGRDCPSVFSYPAKAAAAKAVPAVFARQSVSVTTYFAEGFFRRIPIRNGTVAVESISPTAAERAHGRIDECRAVPPPRKTISLPSSQ